MNAIHALETYKVLVNLAVTYRVSNDSLVQRRSALLDGGGTVVGILLLLLLVIRLLSVTLIPPLRDGIKLIFVVGVENLRVPLARSSQFLGRL